MHLRLPNKSNFTNPIGYYVWCFFAFILFPLSFHPRFYDLNNPLIEPHSWRQNQTALTAYYFNKGFGSVFDYRSPYGGKLWNYVIEFPLYQLLVSKLMLLGFSLEVSGRTLSLFFFFTGGIFLYKAISRLLSKEACLWSTVLYLVSPFNIVYSRTVLIDSMVQCFSLICGYYLICLLQEKNKTKYFTLSVIFGVLASTGKITIWFSVALFASVFLFHSIFVKKEKIGKNKFFIISLAIQAFFALIWMHWSSSVSAITGDYNDPRWFFGELPQRVEGWRWRRIFDIVGRSLLSDFMLIPFLIALIPRGKWPELRGTLLIVILVPILILFNIHVHHDYYFITECPYVFILTGIGMFRLFGSSRKPVVYSAVILMGLSFAWRMKNFDSILGIIYHDYRPDIAQMLKLKKLTSSDDLIYYQSGVIGKLEIPFYSERRVFVGPNRFFGKGVSPEIALSPNVFWILIDMGYEYLEPYKTVSLLTDQSDFHLLRTLNSDKTDLDPKLAISVSLIPDATARGFIGEVKEINSCDAEEGYLVFKIPSEIKRIELYSSQTQHTYILPSKLFLYLPSKNTVGCRFTVSLRK